MSRRGSRIGWPSKVTAAGGRLIEAGREPQRRGLAAAGGADDAEEFAGPHLEARASRRWSCRRDRSVDAVERDLRLLRRAGSASQALAAHGHGSALAAWRIDEVERRVQMLLQHRLRRRDVARQHAVGEHLMRCDELLAAVESRASSPGGSDRPGRRDRNAPPAAAASRRPPAARCESPCAARSKSSAPSRNSSPVRSIWRRIWCSALTNAGLPGVVAMDDGQPQRLDLDDGAHAGDVEQILAADVGDAKAALADADDQPARHQPRQSLAQRRGADLVALHEIDDAEPRARRQTSGENVVLEERGGALAQACRPRRPVGSIVRSEAGIVSGSSISASACVRSSLDCSIFCDDITSIHQASCSVFSTGSEWFGGVALTSSSGCLVNFAIEAEAFSRSSLTIMAASAMRVAEFLDRVAAFFSAHSRDAA